MEAWLKFRAPGVTLTVGLNIGRIVFNYLNKIEWIFVLLTLMLLYAGGGLMYKRSIILLIPILMVVIQTFWLLPALDSRAVNQISGLNLAPSQLHFYYLGAEILKVGALILFAIKLFR